MFLPSIVSGFGPMKCHSVRLRRGADLMGSIKALCAEKHIGAGVVLSAVGCISKGRVRDASGVTIREIADHCEIVSLNGTVSERRCHLHIALSKEDLKYHTGHRIRIVLGERAIPYAEAQAYNGKYVIVEGIFDMAGGHWEAFQGAIKDVSRYQLREDDWMDLEETAG